MTTSAPTPDGKEGIMKSLSVNLDDVVSVLGKGQVALHFESRYSRNKNFPTHFSYKDMTLEAVLGELKKYKVSPKTALSREHAAKIMRESSMYVTDTYVIELPGDAFIIYQLGTIRDLHQGIKGLTQQFKPQFEFILKGDPKHPYDDRGIRKLEWEGFDNDGRPLETEVTDGGLNVPGYGGKTIDTLLKSPGSLLPDIVGLLNRLESDKDGGEKYLPDLNTTNSKIFFPEGNIKKLK